MWTSWTHKLPQPHTNIHTILACWQSIDCCNRHIKYFWDISNIVDDICSNMNRTKTNDANWEAGESACLFKFNFKDTWHRGLFASSMEMFLWIGITKVINFCGLKHFCLVSSAYAIPNLDLTFREIWTYKFRNYLFSIDEPLLLWFHISIKLIWAMHILMNKNKSFVWKKKRKKTKSKKRGRTIFRRFEL